MSPSPSTSQRSPRARRCASPTAAGASASEQEDKSAAIDDAFDRPSAGPSTGKQRRTTARRLTTATRAVGGGPETAVSGGFGHSVLAEQGRASSSGVWTWLVIAMGSLLMLYFLFTIFTSK